jgi:hypothetical protein
LGIAYRFLDDADVIVTVWDGTVTPAEWADAIARHGESPEWLKGKRRLTDARTADPSGITPEDVDAVSANYGPGIQATDARLAIVASDGWALAQQVESTMRKLGLTTVVFNDVHTACAWLGVDADLVSVATREIRQELRGARREPDE